MPSSDVSTEKKTLHNIVAGALFDFCAHLTTQPGTLKLGAKHESPAIIEPLKAWAAERGLKLDDAAVQSWQDSLQAEDPA
jgi:hypothetical protein